MKLKVLVFPCGSEIGLEIHNALKWCFNHVELVGGTSTRDHGDYVYKNIIKDIPIANDKAFIPAINRIVTEHKIDFIYPAHDDVIVTLAKAHSKKRLECEAIIPDLKTAVICRSKSATYNKFKEILNTPKIYPTVNSIPHYPVFLKPNIGQGSKGTSIAYTNEEVVTALKKDPSLLILEYLPGDEFTIDCFTDRNGALLFVGSRQRVRTVNGINVSSKPVTNKAFQKNATLINNNLNLRGAWFFQMKYNSSGELSLLEIAPRIAGTMALYRNLGVNFPLLTLFDRKNLDVKVTTNQLKIELDRALITRFKTNLRYTKVYVDLDDCLLINNEVNWYLVGFLYQALNNHKKLILITKHSNDLKTTLKKYRLFRLFDEIIYLTKDQDKATFIDPMDSIYIDDSFAERQNVQTKLKIPVYAPDAVESLINWLR